MPSTSWPTAIQEVGGADHRERTVTAARGLAVEGDDDVLPGRSAT